ncbi:MAG TPA: hypothetical protein VIG06_05520 [Kofleriaceae bacterium]
MKETREMGKKKSSDLRRAVLKRETLRRLDAATLADEDLVRVQGGGYVLERRAPTCPCRTSCD